ncbi:MAG: DUF222 domain-containing protein [Actinomycetes bacterium]
MFEWFVATNREYRDRVARVDVDTMLGADARRLVVIAEEMKRAADALLTIAIGRVESSGAWAGGRARSAEDWVADTTGGSWGEAKGRVEFAGALRSLPDTAAALVEGRISGTQAAIVVKAGAVDPGSEHRLLDLAGRTSVEELSDAAERVVASASGRAADEQAAVHRTRYLRTWVDGGGGFRIEGRMTRAAGAQVLAALEPLMEVEFTDARRQGRRERPDAYRADALVRMAERSRQGGTEDHAAPSAHIVVRVDHAALLRGDVEVGEQCEIDGLGPIPVAEAERLMGDPILTVLAMTGTQVTAASTTTRVVRRSLRDALAARDRVCVVPGCGIAKGLEIDHLVPLAQGGPTSIGNLQRLCPWHHREKTAGRATLARWETDDGPQFGWLPRVEGSEAPPSTAADPPRRSLLTG